MKMGLINGVMIIPCGYESYIYTYIINNIRQPINIIVTKNTIVYIVIIPIQYSQQ